MQAILHRLQAGEMPPKGSPRPPLADVRTATGWIEEFQRIDAAVKPTPGA
jgi:hypothetical protein